MNSVRRISLLCVVLAIVCVGSAAAVPPGKSSATSAASVGKITAIDKESITIQSESEGSITVRLGGVDGGGFKEGDLVKLWYDKNSKEARKIVACECGSGGKQCDAGYKCVDCRCVKT